MWYELLIGGIISITTFSLVIAVPLYVLVLIVIITHRNVEPFNSEFFVIFIALGVVDIVCYLLFFTKKIFFLGYIPMFFQPYNESNYIASVYYYPFWIFGILQYQLTFVLSFNRFISIVFPGFYNVHWTIGKTYTLISICTLSALALALPVPLSNCQITQYTVQIDGINRTLHYGPVTSNTKTAKYLSNVWSIHVYGLLLSSATFYAIMLITLRKKKMIGNKRKLEMQMFWVGFMIFALNSIFTFYFFLRDTVLVNISANSHVHEWILLFISDIYDLPNGFMLWLTSSSIRRIIIQNFRKSMKCGSVDMLVWVKAAKSSDAPKNRPPTATAMPRHTTLLFVN